MISFMIYLQRIGLSIFFTLGLFSASAQKYPIEWSESFRSGSQLNTILPISGSDFYALRWSGGILGSLTLSKHVHFENILQKRIALKVENGMANYEGIQRIGNKLIVFLSDRLKGVNHLYMQEFNEELMPKGQAVEVATFEEERGRGKGIFQTIVSRDQNYMGIIWEIPGRRDTPDRYGFKILDSTLQEHSSGDYALPFDPKLCTIDQHYLSNTGDYFLSLTEFESIDRKLFRDYQSYKSVHILHVTEDEVEDMVIDVQGKRIDAMTMSSDNERVFTILGVYGEKGKPGVSGLIYLRANFLKREIIDEGSTKFSKDFITQNWSDRERQRADRRESRGKGEPQFYNYVVRQSEVLKDGSIVGSLEQFYVVVNTYTDPRTGVTRTSFTYYYNDIIAFKVGKDGGFDWLTKIRKTQVSTNDDGYFSSYMRFIDNGKMCVLFNDNINNYDDDGRFIDTNRIYPSSFTKKRNAVALVQVNLQDGSVDRQMLFDRKEVQALAVPRKSPVDYNQRDVLIYATFGRRERFGLMKLAK